MKYTVSFTEQELAFVLSVLGDMPTKSNAYIVLNSINSQVQAQQGNGPEVAQAE